MTAEAEIKQRNIQHSRTALLRQPIYSRLAGYEDVNDADRLGVDPVMRQVVGGRDLSPIRIECRQRGPT